MTASLSNEKYETVNISEVWYDDAAKALEDEPVAPLDMVIHITEVRFPLGRVHASIVRSMNGIT